MKPGPPSASTPRYRSSRSYLSWLTIFGALGAPPFIPLPTSTITRPSFQYDRYARPFCTSMSCSTRPVGARSVWNRAISFGFFGSLRSMIRIEPVASSVRYTCVPNFGCVYTNAECTPADITRSHAYRRVPARGAETRGHRVLSRLVCHERAVVIDESASRRHRPGRRQPGDLLPRRIPRDRLEPQHIA